jgi:hypothetical protein
MIDPTLHLTDRIERRNLHGDVINYSVYQEVPTTPVGFHRDIFAACRSRVPKNRTPYVLVIP